MIQVALGWRATWPLWMNRLLALFPLDLSDELSVHQPVNYVRAPDAEASQADRFHLSPRTTERVVASNREDRLRPSQRCSSLSKGYHSFDHLRSFYSGDSSNDSISNRWSIEIERNGILCSIDQRTSSYDTHKRLRKKQWEYNCIVKTRKTNCSPWLYF